MEPTRSRKFNPSAALTIALLASVGIYAAGKYVRGLILGFPDPLELHTTSSSPAPSPSSSPSIQALQKAQAPMPHSRRLPSTSSQSFWQVFSKRFGPELKADRGSDGHVVAVHGALGSGERAGPEFKPEDSDQAIARAREIVSAASETLGLDPGLPLGDPRAKTGPVSAQVYFAETLDGVPLAPNGSVTVDLGPEGEILNVTSDYVRDLHVTNRRVLSSSQAQIQAEASVPEPNSALSTLAGGPVVWVASSESGGGSVGRAAYKFNVAGRQVIIDAEDGRVLFKRDRRQF